MLPVAQQALIVYPMSCMHSDQSDTPGDKKIKTSIKQMLQFMMEAEKLKAAGAGWADTSSVEDH